HQSDLLPQRQARHVRAGHRRARRRPPSRAAHGSHDPRHRPAASARAGQSGFAPADRRGCAGPGGRQVKLRFVTSTEPSSAALRAHEGPMAPFVGFTPSHVEMLIATDGKFGYLGAHADGGVRIRDIGYDKATLAHELVVDVGGDDGAAEAYARKK